LIPYVASSLPVWRAHVPSLRAQGSALSSAFHFRDRNKRLAAGWANHWDRNVYPAEWPLRPSGEGPRKVIGASDRNANAFLAPIHVDG
jgi:hypothetical protein